MEKNVERAGCVYFNVVSHNFHEGIVQNQRKPSFLVDI
jgi:hypothetical protein